MAIATHRRLKYNVTLAKLFKHIIAMSDAERTALLENLEGHRPDAARPPAPSPPPANPGNPPPKRGRTHPRKDCMLAVDCADDNRVCTNFVGDISPGGMFIYSTETYPIGKELTLSFAFLKNQRPFKVKARVTRRNAQGIGVKFDHMTPYERNVIKTTVDRMHAGEIDSPPA